MRSTFTSAVSAVLVLLFALCVMGPSQSSALTIPTMDSLAKRAPSFTSSSSIDVAGLFSRSPVAEANPEPKGSKSGSKAPKVGKSKSKKKFPKGAIIGIVIGVIIIILIVLIILFLARRRKAKGGAIAH